MERGLQLRKQLVHQTERSKENVIFVEKQKHEQLKQQVINIQIRQLHRPQQQKAIRFIPAQYVDIATRIITQMQRSSCRQPQFWRNREKPHTT